MKIIVHKLDLNIKSTYLCRNKNEKAMKTINKTEWYAILSTELAKHEWIMKAMNESQVSELVTNIKSDLRKQYRVV